MQEVSSLRGELLLNLDNRSFRLNDEENLNIWDADFAAAETLQFEVDLKRAKRITLDDWRNRPLRERALEKLASLLAGQLWAQLQWPIAP